MTHSRVRRSLAALAAVALTSASPSAASPTVACQAAKIKAASKYGGCRQQADATFALNLDATKYAAAVAKCLTKFQTLWPKLEAKAVAQGAACPSMGDQAAVQGAVDDHTSNVATALGGGTLEGCSVPTGQRLETGALLCFDVAGAAITCTGSGQDGESGKGLPRSYSDPGIGTVVDNRTGLVWEKLSNDGSIHDKTNLYEWAFAFGKISTLNDTSFAGFTDWRLPNIEELTSLLHLEGVSPAVLPSFNVSCAPGCTVLTCSCTQPTTYWSSTSSRSVPSAAWRVDFGSGLVFPFDKQNPFSGVRAVRGGV
jgi:Protein of unknown function (DUF1566)